MDPIHIIALPLVLGESMLIELTATGNMQIIKPVQFAQVSYFIYFLWLLSF